MTSKKNDQIGATMRHLNDEQLEKSADQARARELGALQEMLKHLREIDRRKLFSKRGYMSLHHYAIERFKYSPDEAHRRISAMRLLKDMPEIESKISDGSLQLTHLTQAHSFFRKVDSIKDEKLTKAEKLEVLSKLENTTKAEAKKVLYNEDVKARYSFEADQKLEAVVEELKGLHPHLHFDELVRKVFEMAWQELSPAAKAKRIREKEQKKIESSRTKQNFRAGAENLSMKEASAKNLAISNQQMVREPEGKSAKQITDQTACPIAGPIADQKIISRNEMRSRYIQQNIKREVWFRAQGKCENCQSTFALEYDHIVPFAKGGLTSKENLRLLCRNCNQRKAIEHYGLRKVSNHITQNA
jgi:hypothetical protein